LLVVRQRRAPDVVPDLRVQFLSDAEPPANRPVGYPLLLSGVPGVGGRKVGVLIIVECAGLTTSGHGVR